MIAENIILEEALEITPVTELAKVRVSGSGLLATLLGIFGYLYSISRPTKVSHNVGSKQRPGEGYTVNIPWEVAANEKNPPGDAELLYAFDRVFLPKLGIS